MSPTGSEQVLSLCWALQAVADFSEEDAIVAAREVFGIEPDDWQTCVTDRSWFIGDPRWNSREEIERRWNQRHSHATGIWLDEDAWHLPLWQLWLTHPKMILAANLNYLVKLNGRGTVVGLAKATGRGQSTASKWGRWKDEGRKVRVPPRTILPKVLEFFGLKPSCDLHRDPLFLGQSAMRDAVLRARGKQYLETLSGENLALAVNQLRDESTRQVLKKLGDYE